MKMITQLLKHIQQILKIVGELWNIVGKCLELLKIIGNNWNNIEKCWNNIENCVKISKANWKVFKLIENYWLKISQQSLKKSWNIMEHFLSAFYWYYSKAIIISSIRSNISLLVVVLVVTSVVIWVTLLVTLVIILIKISSSINTHSGVILSVICCGGWGGFERLGGLGWLGYPWEGEDRIG